MSNIIYDDLGIDVEDSRMTRDPVGFQEDVFKAAEELKTLMKQNDSVEVYLRSIKKETSSKIEEVKNALNSVYVIADEAPIQELDSILAYAKQLVKDLETLKWHKAGNDVAMNQGILDKRTAHEQYCRLRDSYNKYVDSMVILEQPGSDKLEKLPAMPGNYGSNVSFKSYVFIFDGESEGYRNHLRVCKRIGIESHNLQDTLDYIKSHPELKITVKEITS